jgi:hypothetical protein
VLSSFEHELSIIRPQDVRMVASIHSFICFMAAKVLIIYETRRKYKHFNSNKS